MNGKWAMATLPQKMSNTSFLGGSDLVVFKNSPNRAAAWKFVQYLTNPATQVKWYNTVADLPSVQSAWNMTPLANNKNLTVFHAQLSNANGPPAVPKWDEVATMIDNDMQQVMYGKATPEQAAAQMQQQATSIGSGQ